MMPSPPIVADPDLGVEEPERAVVVVDVARLVTARRHRGELIRVAEHHDLHAAERLGAAAARLPQRAVDARP